MPHLPPILASDDDAIVKVVVTAIIVGIGLVVKVISSTRKPTPRPGQQQRSWQDILDDLQRGRPSGPAQGTPPPLPQRAALPPRIPQPAPMRAPARPQPTRQQSRTPAQPPRRPQQAPQRPRPQRPPRRQTTTDRAAANLAQMQRTGPADPPPAQPATAPTRLLSDAAPAAPARSVVGQPPLGKVTAQSLRRQFILTEILQPPLALRDQRP